VQAAVRSPLYERFVGAATQLNMAMFALHEAGHTVETARRQLRQVLEEVIREEPGLKDHPAVAHWLTNIDAQVIVRA